MNLTNLIRFKRRKKSLHIQLKASEAVPGSSATAEDFVDRYGSFSVSSLNSPQLKIIPHTLSDDVTIGFVWNADRFLIKFPAGIKPSTETDKLLSSLSSQGRIELFWPSVPESFYLDLQNGYRLEFKEKERLQSLFNQKTKFAAAFVVGMIINSLFLAIGFTIDPSERYARHHDLSQLSVRVVHLSQAQSSKPKPPRTSEQKDQIVQRTKLSNLMKSIDLEDLIRESRNKKKNQIEANTEVRQALAKDAEMGQVLAEPESSSEDDLNLDSIYLSEQFKQANRDLEICFSDTLIRDRQLEGSPLLLIDFNKDGKATRVTVEGMRAKDSSVTFMQSCFLKAFQKLKMKKPNQAFRVTRSLIFQKDRGRT